jgi:hypothetical protein
MSADHGDPIDIETDGKTKQLTPYTLVKALQARGSFTTHG